MPTIAPTSMPGGDGGGGFPGDGADGDDAGDGGGGEGDGGTDGDGGGDGGGGDGGGDDGRIFPEHPSPILHAPRDIISRKGKSLTPT